MFILPDVSRFIFFPFSFPFYLDECHHSFREGCWWISSSVFLHLTMSWFFLHSWRIFLQGIEVWVHSFFQHWKNIPLPPGLHGPADKSTVCHSNYFSPIGKMSFFSCCFQEFFFCLLYSENCDAWISFYLVWGVLSFLIL